MLFDDFRAQVVGWPPIRNSRKNIMATNNSQSKNKEDNDGKQGSGCLYVKVSMDGAPYLRKVDLKTYSNYKELSSALEKMFSGFTVGELCLCSMLLCNHLVQFDTYLENLSITQYMIDMLKFIKTHLLNPNSIYNYTTIRQYQQHFLFRTVVVVCYDRQYLHTVCKYNCSKSFRAYLFPKSWQSSVLCNDRYSKFEVLAWHYYSGISVS